MLEKLRQVDASVIGDLVRIKEEELILRERLAQMESKKEGVSPVVYRRVRQDYEARQAALDKESRPLKDRARQEYAKLEILRGEVERSFEEATLEKEELQFRRELGEFPDDQFKERLAECEKHLSERKQQLDEVVKLKERFVAAFHSEHELELPAGVAAPIGPEAPDATIVRVETPSRPREDTVTQVPGGSSASVAAPSSGSAMRSGAAPLVSSPAPSPEATLLRSQPANTTRALPTSRIIMIADNKPGEEYSLKPGITSIGRSPKNQIHLPYSDVSRQHARIELTPDGHRVMDLGAENGVYVNGRRVKEHMLKDGDIIQIGTQKLMYKG